MQEVQLFASALVGGGERGEVLRVLSPELQLPEKIASGAGKPLRIGGFCVVEPEVVRSTRPLLLIQAG